jgi:FAD dependent monooxygenase
MAPNIGQGANTAIEDVAVLSSLVNRLINKGTAHSPSSDEIENMLQEYKTLRFERVKSTCGRAKFGARFHARDDWIKAWIGRYVFPRIAGLVESQASSVLVGGGMIDFLPIPERNTGGHPSKRLDVGKPDQRPWTMLWISSFLVFLSLPVMHHYLLSAS